MDAAYQKALDYIYNFLDFEKSGNADQALHWDLRRMAALLKRLGNPHLASRTVHIAGTKGKGSVAAMIASVLTASGYKTGLYTSPHLNRYNERIRIGPELISDADIVEFVEKLKPDITAVNRENAYGMLTTFEVTTAIAFAYFREKGVDFQVIETGLGGRLDATNVVDPEESIITAISLDHTKILGDTLAKIAGEKAGIIKPGKTVVSAPQFPDVEKVLTGVSEKNGSKLFTAGKELKWEYTGTKDDKQSMRVRGRLGTYEIEIPLLGRHQLENAVVAVAALEVLQEKGYKISSESVKMGLAGVDWPGRLQVLSRTPLTVVDGAHNGESAARLVEGLKQYFKFENAILIIGVSSDKDLAGIIKEFKPVFGRVIATSANHPRAKPANILVEELTGYGVNATAGDDVPNAIRKAEQIAGPNDLICLTGSLFVVGDALEFFRLRTT